MGLKLFAVCPDFHSSDLLLRAQLICSRLVVVVVFNSFSRFHYFFYNVARIFANLRLILCIALCFLTAHNFTPNLRAHIKKMAAFPSRLRVITYHFFFS